MRHSVFLSIFFLILTGLSFSPGHAGAESSKFRLCVVNERPDQPDFALNQYSKLHNCLKKEMAAKNIQVDKLVVAENVRDLIDKIRSGEVDAFIEGVMPTLEAERMTGAVEPRVLVWRKGQREYRSVFFVPRLSGVKKLTDLKGLTLAFESPRSTSAYYIPRIVLARQGLGIAPAPAGKSPDKVNFLFAGSELNQAYWVQRGKVEAGVFNDGDWERTPPQIRDQLWIIHETKPVLRWLLSFHKNIDPGLRETVTDTLISLPETETGREALRQAEGIARFEKLLEEDRENLDYWRKLLKTTKI